MGYSIIPKLPRNRYNYVGPAYTETPTLSAAFQVSGGGSGGGSLTNTTLAAMSKVVQQYADEKGFITSDNVKTVNGYSLIGYGDIEVTSEGTVDLSGYVSKVELYNAGYLTNSYAETYYATKQFVNDECDDVKVACYAYAESKTTYVDLSSYVTKVEMDEELSSYAKLSDLASYATQSYVAEKTSEIPQADLSSYVTKTELENAGYLTEHQSLASYAKLSDLNSYVTKTQLENASYATRSDLRDYVTTDTLIHKTAYFVTTNTTVVDSGTIEISNDDGIIVLTSSYARVNMPESGIQNGKTIYIINTSGTYFTSYTEGMFISKDPVSASRQNMNVSNNVTQYIYYNGNWYVI